MTRPDNIHGDGFENRSVSQIYLIQREAAFILDRLPVCCFRKGYFAITCAMMCSGFRITQITGFYNQLLMEHEYNYRLYNALMR